MRNGYRYKTGITLSGGAARGLSHLGALQALNEAGIHPEVISGVSGGGILGAMYASGLAPHEIKEMFKQENLFRNLQLKFPKKGFLNTNKLFKILDQYLEAKTFEDLEIPLYITATNFNTGKQVVFYEGNLIRALQASSAIPVIFQPVEYHGHLLVDGGLVSNLPIEPIQDQCEKIIGVNVNPIGKMDEFDNFLAVMERTLHLSIWANVEKNIDQCTLFIEPEGLRKFNIFNLSNVEEIYQAGYDHTARILEKRMKDQFI